MTVADTAFGQLMAIAGRAAPDFVRIESDVPALKTRFHADEAAAAAIAAGATVAADIWTLRSGEKQTVTVNSREAAAGLVSFLHQTFEDASRAPDPLGQLAASRTAANGFHKTRDGRYVFLHPSFPESTKRLLKVLNCPDTPDDVAATMLKWDALDFENAVAAAGACAGMARTPEEWDSSEQGRILAARPVVEVVKIGESAPEPFAAGGDAPLSGVRVLDLTRVLAGPTCARTLAQYGADAMVISSPNLPSVPYFVTDTGHGKRAAFVDLSTDHGRAVLRDLARASDVFSQSYRQGALERLGFGPLELAEMRPGIIVTAINCYGHEGPWRGRPGWEQLGQTVTGMAVVHGGDRSGGDGRPELQPGAVTDYSTGFLAAFGTMVALQRRALYGGSYLVRVSLAQTAVWIRGLGLADETRLTNGRALSAEEIAGWSIRSETGFGGMTHLRPPVTMSATPARWRRGVVPLGTDAAAWASS
ncbi:MAG: CoA transferase [Alphaproteobacteria bacterium]|nr:CoA transferase [Alphaproteobacteria bacterium]MBL7098472.1 CoA transferase [Alphaproteobacteria bacterium]